MTAVEWALNEFSKELKITVDGEKKELLDNIARKAYEMEDEQKIEFAKLHVEKALKFASEGVVMKDMNEDCHEVDEDGNFPDMYVIDRNSILNSYPLENIK